MYIMPVLNIYTTLKLSHLCFSFLFCTAGSPRNCTSLASVFFCHAHLHVTNNKKEWVLCVFSIEIRAPTVLLSVCVRGLTGRLNKYIMRLIPSSARWKPCKGSSDRRAEASQCLISRASGSRQSMFGLPRWVRSWVSDEEAREKYDSQVWQKQYAVVKISGTGLRHTQNQRNLGQSVWDVSLGGVRHKLSNTDEPATTDTQESVDWKEPTGNDEIYQKVKNTGEKPKKMQLDGASETWRMLEKQI